MRPLSRRGFMSSSAAAAAGYTLAVCPLRADAIHTDTNGLDAGMAKVKVADGDMSWNQLIHWLKKYDVLS